MNFKIRIKTEYEKYPTSWSSSKLPDSSLYSKLSPRGRTLSLTPTNADYRISGKSREKKEPLFPLLLLFLFSLPFLFLLFPSLYQFSSTTQVGCLPPPPPPPLPRVTSLLAIFGFPLSTYPKLWIPTLLGGDTCPTWVLVRPLFDLLSI